LLLVTTRLTELGRASMTLEQVAWLGEGADAPRLCEGQIRIGWVDASAMKPARIPATLIAKLHNA
jgi:acyl-CoA thioester hydrolase